VPSTSPSGARLPSAIVATAGPLAPGGAFGTRSHIIRMPGIGGMGAVYQAWDDELGVSLALKVIRPEERRRRGARPRQSARQSNGSSRLFRRASLPRPPVVSDERGAAASSARLRGVSEPHSVTAGGASAAARKNGISSFDIAISD
jgi:hypothetical protein